MLYNVMVLSIDYRYGKDTFLDMIRKTALILPLSQSEALGPQGLSNANFFEDVDMVSSICPHVHTCGRHFCLAPEALY